MKVAEGLRTVGLDVVLHCATAAGIGSFKSQMKKADASGAAFAVILGDDEVAANEATVKPLMRDGGAPREQWRVGLDALTTALVEALVGSDDGADDDADDDADDEDDDPTADDDPRTDDARPGAAADGVGARERQH